LIASAEETKLPLLKDLHENAECLVANNNTAGKLQGLLKTNNN
jgi:hypothetical protein